MLSFLKDLNQKNSIPVLDGVRAIACLLVVSFHLNLITIDVHVWKPYPVIDFFTSALAMQGGSGVTLFFVLSGFLLFMPYARALLFEKQWPSMGRFYLRRILRIWPGYYVSLFLMIWLLQPQYFQPEHLKDLGLFLTFFMDSTASTYQKINGPFWTLAVEWQFYMLLPLLALFFGWIMKRAEGSRRNVTKKVDTNAQAKDATAKQGISREMGSSQKRRWWVLMVCLGGMMAWGVFSRYWGLYFYTNPTETVLVPRAWLNVPLFFLYGADGKFLEDFAAGMLVSCIYVVIKQGAAENELYGMAEKIRRGSLWIFGAGLLVLAFMTLWNGYQRFQPRVAPIMDMAIPMYNWISEFGLSIGYGLCVAALLFGPAALKRPFEWPLLRLVGLVSYGMYMWHLPLFIQLTIHSAGLPGWNRAVVYAVYCLFVVLVIIPFCTIFYKVIEQPWIKLGDRLLKKQANFSKAQEVFRKTESRILDKV